MSTDPGICEVIRLRSVIATVHRATVPLARLFSVAWRDGCPPAEIGRLIDEAIAHLRTAREELAEEPAPVKKPARRGKAR